jgi:S1-C subfamily serine protease
VETAADTVAAVRASTLALVAVVSAVLGGAGALAIGRAAGWVGEARVQTVLAPPAPAAPAPATVRAPAPLPRDFDAARIYAARTAGVVTIHVTYAGGSRSQGSGFVVSPAGVILTSAHVITNAGEVPANETAAAQDVVVEFSDRDRVQATVVGWDVFDDVGVVRVDPAAHALQPLPLGDSEAVAVGSPVAAIGSPFGNEGSLSVGVVSATRRGVPVLTSQYQLVDAIQTDAPINRGNSGGPLFDARGRVIGINGQIRSETGNAEGVGFAVPINSAKRSMEQLLQSGRVAYAYVGITTDDLTPTIARRAGYAVPYGAVVSSVVAGSPGARAGLRGGSESEQVLQTEVTRGGDVVVAIGGTPVRSGSDLVRVVSEELRPGQTADFEIVRGGRRLTVPVKVVERPLAPNEG